MGTRFGVVVNHPGADASRTILASTRRALRAEGVTLDPVTTDATEGAA